MDAAIYAPLVLKMNKRVTEGVKLLDTKVSNWWAYVNLGRLNLASPDHCVLAQIYGEYADGLDALVLDSGVNYGFVVDWNDSEYVEAYEILDVLWGNEIRARRMLSE